MKSLLFALYQLTRFPLPSVPFDEASCGRSTLFFPLVGLSLGGVMAALAWATEGIFTVQVQAALLVTVLVVLTGGIHLDGFMDSVDGLFSGRSRERKLEIMRDSRVGAFGVIGVVCLLLLKYSLFQAFADQDLWLLLPLVPALSRWGMSLAVIAFPYARPEGLGKIYDQYAGGRELAGATLIAGAVAAALWGLRGLCLMALVGGVTFLLGRAVTKELGGLTGDIYGFVNELLEVFLLLAAFLVLRVNSLL